MCQVVIEIVQGKDYTYCTGEGEPYCAEHMPQVAGQTIETYVGLDPEE